MSSVRMCDRCGNIFSEREDGWETYTATQVKKNPDTRRRETETVYLDACPTCAVGGFDATVPQPKLGGMDADFFSRQAAIEAAKKDGEETTTK